MARTSLWLGMIVASVLATRFASAQEAPRNVSIFQRTLAAPTRALELGVSAGYQQGVGALRDEPGSHVQDVAGVGAGAEVFAGYRASPRLFFGAYGTGALYTSLIPDSSSRSVAMGVLANWHFRPYRSFDPWVSFGAGYRVFWDSPPGALATTHKAIQVARFGLGVDYRFNPEVAVGPFVGADLSLFISETRPGEPSISAGGALSTFVSAGIAARFDLLGRAVHPAIDVASR